MLTHSHACFVHSCAHGDQMILLSHYLIIAAINVGLGIWIFSPWASGKGNVSHYYAFWVWLAFGIMQFGLSAIYSKWIPPEPPCPVKKSKEKKKEKLTEKPPEEEEEEFKEVAAVEEEELSKKSASQKEPPKEPSEVCIIIIRHRSLIVK